MFQPRMEQVAVLMEEQIKRCEDIELSANVSRLEGPLVHTDSGKESCLSGWSR